MEIHFNPKYRIKRNADYEEKVDYLIKQIKLFSDYASLLMVSAVIGYKNHTYAPDFKAASDGVMVQFFSLRDRNVIDLIAFLHDKEQKVLSSDEKYRVLEGYANGGFPILLERLGIDFNEPAKNDRLVILERYFNLLLMDGFIIQE